MDDKKHGNVIVKFNELNDKLKPHGLFINAWGRLAIAKLERPHTDWVSNNIDSIEEIEQWVEGFLYGLKTKD